VMVVAAATIAGFLAGTFFESRSSMIAVSPSVVSLGPDAQNFTVKTNCDGASQSSSNGWWECSVAMKNTGTIDGALLNVSAPQTVNLVVWPPLPAVMRAGAEAAVNVTGQLGYSGSVTVYLGFVD
jgi:hypothetical protein